MTINRSILVLIAILTATACGPDNAGMPEQLDSSVADAVYRSGKVWTVNPAQPTAEAVAVRDGKIIFVGSDEEARSFIGPDTAVRDLGGRLMLPGFQDAHLHPISGGVEASLCDLNGLGSVALYRDRIAGYATANPDVPWITGGGWSMLAFGPGALASKKIIDELVADRPVFLTSQDGHSGWANSKALEIAGITKDTPDPPDGIIDRDPDTGEPVGSLQEGAMSLIEKHVPPMSVEQRVQGLKYARDMLHGYGITSIQEASAYESDLEAYKELDEAGQLNLRVVVALRWAHDEIEEQIPRLIDLRERYTKGNVRATTIKIMQDGVMENYTAVMLEPYRVPNRTKGIPMVDPEFLKTAVTLLDEAGFQVHFHAIGDAAVRQSLDAIEFAQAENSGARNRHHISHLELIDPADIPRFAELGVTANFQPLWAYPDSYITDLTLPFIGPERGQWLYPIGSVFESGGRVAFGSDWSVSTANPFVQIEVAVRRSDPEKADGAVLLSEQAVSLAQAIEAFTINSAWVNRLEAQTGSLEVGKAADLIVIDRNLFEIDPREISETRVMMTMVDGKIVYQHAPDENSQ